MRSVLQKIDRIAKPIKKNTSIVTEALHKKEIYLEEENFDILQLLQQKQTGRGKESTACRGDKDVKRRHRKRRREPAADREESMKLLNERKRSESNGSMILRDTSKERLNKRQTEQEQDGPLPSGMLTPEHKSPTNRLYSQTLIIDDDILDKLMQAVPKQQEAAA